MKAQCEHSDTGLCFECFMKECKNESSGVYTIDSVGLDCLVYWLKKEYAGKNVQIIVRKEQ
jgi:hypothetical protein